MSVIMIMIILIKMTLYDDTDDDYDQYDDDHGENQDND